MRIFACHLHCPLPWWCLPRRLEIHRDDSLTESSGLKVYLQNKSRLPCWVDGTIRVTNHRSPNNDVAQSALLNDTSVEDSAAFADIKEELDAAAGRESVRVLDGRNLLVDGSDFVDDRGCLTLSVTLKGCNCRHAACEVLREKRGRGIDLASWVAAETQMNDEGGCHIANSVSVALSCSEVRLW